MVDTVRNKMSCVYRSRFLKESYRCRSHRVKGCTGAVDTTVARSWTL